MAVCGFCYAVVEGEFGLSGCWALACAAGFGRHGGCVWQLNRFGTVFNRLCVVWGSNVRTMADYGFVQIV